MWGRKGKKNIEIFCNILRQLKDFCRKRQNVGILKEIVLNNNIVTLWQRIILKNIRKYQSYFKANWDFLRKKHNIGTWKAIRKILYRYIFIVPLGNYRKLRKVWQRIRIWKDVRKNIIRDIFILTLGNYRKVRKCVTKNK